MIKANQDFQTFQKSAVEVKDPRPRLLNELFNNEGAWVGMRARNTAARSRLCFDAETLSEANMPDPHSIENVISAIRIAMFIKVECCPRRLVVWP